MAEFIDREKINEIAFTGAVLVKGEVKTERIALLREIDEIPAVPVRDDTHGKWVFTKKHLWYRDKNGEIDEWRLDFDIHNGPECQICERTFCMHCTRNWADTECEIGHYYCSRCAETSKDAHEKYCPGCGAQMDGGADNG